MDLTVGGYERAPDCGLCFDVCGNRSGTASIEKDKHTKAVIALVCFYVLKKAFICGIIIKMGDCHP